MKGVGKPMKKSSKSRVNADRAAIRQVLTILKGEGVVIDEDNDDDIDQQHLSSNINNIDDEGTTKTTRHPQTSVAAAAAESNRRVSTAMTTPNNLNRNTNTTAATDVSPATTPHRVLFEDVLTQLMRVAVSIPSSKSTITHN